MHAVLRALSLTAAVAALAGCARYQPSPLDVAHELAVLRGRDVQTVVVDRERLGQHPDREMQPFNAADGLDEREVVSVALTLNPELRTKRAAVGESQATLITAGAWPNPELGVGVQPGISGTSGTLVDADLMFQLLRPGERDARKQIAAAIISETRASLVVAESKLVAEVRLQLLTVLASDRKVALLKEAVDLRQRASATIRRQRDLGEASALSISAIELEQAQAGRDLRQAEAELGREKLTLNRLLGLPPEFRLNLTGVGEPLRVTVFDDLSDEELDRRLVGGRYELRSTEAAYQKAEQELRLAVLEQYPSVRIGPAFERDVDGSKSLGLGMSIELPILNQNQGPIAEKRAARERARAEYVGTLHQVRADAFDARALVRATKAEVDLEQKEVLPLLQRSQDLYETAFRAREINIIDWITAQQRAVEARQAYLDVLVQYRRAVIQLETATGQQLSVSPATRPTTQPNNHPQELNHD